MSDEIEAQARSFRFVVNGLDEGGVALCCPFCGSDYVHPAKVVVEQGFTKTTITRETTHTEVPVHSEGKRGSEITLAFWAECGHRFAYRLAFHKGQLFCELDRLPTGNLGAQEEFWRN